jgi:hypothetical protein
MINIDLRFRLKKLTKPRPANNYFAWKDKCPIKTKSGRTFISFSRTMDEGKCFMVFFIFARCILAGHDDLHCSASETEYKSTSPTAFSVNYG